MPQLSIGAWRGRYGLGLALLLVTLGLIRLYPLLQWNQEKLGKEAVAYWEKKLPELSQATASWNPARNRDLEGFEVVALNQEGQRVYWNSKNLGSKDDRLFCDLNKASWVRVQNGSGWAFVRTTDSLTWIAFYRIEFQFPLKTAALTGGMVWTGPGTALLQAVPPTDTTALARVVHEGRPVFGIRILPGPSVYDPQATLWFNALFLIWLGLLAVPVLQGRAMQGRRAGHGRWKTPVWMLGGMAGLWWLYQPLFGNSSFWALHSFMLWKGTSIAYNQAVVAFCTLWLGIGWFRLPHSGWKYLLAWAALFGALSLSLEAGRYSLGWARPLDWQWDDAAWLLLVLGLVLALFEVMRRAPVAAPGYPVRVGRLWAAGLVLGAGWGYAVSWNLWGQFLWSAWFLLGVIHLAYLYLHARRWALEVVTGMMSLWFVVMCYAQHWKIQAAQSMSQLTTLLEPRPVEAYSFFKPLIDALREDSLGGTTTIREFVARHDLNLRPFFELNSVERLYGDSVPNLLEDTLQWKGSVQELMGLDRSAYLVRVALRAEKSETVGLLKAPDTLALVYLQKFFPEFSPIPSVLGSPSGIAATGSSQGIALYQAGQLIFQNGQFPYPFGLPPAWNNATKSLNPWSWTLRPYQWPVLCLRHPSGQVAVQAMEPPSLMLPVSVGALVWLVLWWVQRLGGISRTGPWRPVFSWTSLRFQAKVQWASSLLVLGVMAALVFFTTWFITRRFQREHNAQMVAKIRQMHRQALASQVLAPLFGEAFNQDLQRWAVVNNLDYFLYDASGRLRTASRSLWFDYSLVSDFVPYKLVVALRDGNQQFVLEEDKINQVGYRSAYHALRDRRGTLLAIVQVPFVDRGPGDQSSLGEYLAGVLSVFGVVLLMAIFMAYRLAKGVAAPVQALTRAMVQTRTGQKAPIPPIRTSGEFAMLVKSYNQMVQSLNENEAKLAVSERNTAWKEMARQIAHDIKNPLTPMKLRLQKMLRDRVQQPELFESRFESDTRLVLQQIDFLTEIADTYREFAREEALETEPLIWAQMVEEVLNWYRDQGQIVWECTEEARQVPVMGHKAQLQRVLQNLIQNAQQAFAEVQGRSFELRVSLELRGQGLVLVVQDNGTGIAAENQNKIFDLNFSTRSQGLGLGLAMARAIAEQHGGTLRLLQSSVEGSTFEWALPVCKPNSDTSDS